MCVIMAATTVRPPAEWYSAAAEANPHGAGIAWLQGGEVHYAKGLDASGIERMAATVRLPFIVHFRWATVGGVQPLLTHPFPIETASPLATSGKARRVLMHNGHVGAWESMVVEARKRGFKAPGGQMSDSRAIAWLTAITGSDRILDRTVGQRFATLDASVGLRLFGDWVTLDGVSLSNTRFIPREPLVLAGDDEDDDAGDAINDLVDDVETAGWFTR